MKKTVFKGKTSTFSSLDFEGLMKQMSAEKLAEEDFPPFSLDEEGTASYTLYYLPGDKVIVEYYEYSLPYSNSEISLLGSSEGIKGVEKKVSEKIAKTSALTNSH